MKFANYTQFYRDRKQHGIEYAAKHTKALGFDSVEYFVCTPSDMLASAKEERAVLDRYGLDVLCYSVSAQLFTDDPSQMVENMKREIEAATILGSPYLHHTLCPNYTVDRTPQSYEEVFERVVDSAEQIARACNQHGMTCLYEPQGAYFNGVEGLDRIVTEMEKRDCTVGICGDFGNSLLVDVDPNEVFDHFASRICHVHIKDFLVTDQILPEKITHFSTSGKRVYEVLVGSGSVDFAHGFAALKKAGYKGNISFETEGSDEELIKAIQRIRQLL